MPRAYATRRVLLVPDLADPALYGAWTMVPRGGLLVDHTPQGNDGVPGASSGVEHTILGPMRRYWPNSGAGGSVIGAPGDFALGDLTCCFWTRMDIGAAPDAYGFGYRLNNNDQWWLRVRAGLVSIFDDIDNAGANLYQTLVQAGRLVHVVGVMDNLENLLYLDNVLVGSGTFASDNWASFAGQLYHGARTTGADPVQGIVSPALVHNAAKDQAWVTKDYMKGASAVQFKTDWGVKQSVGNEVANARVGHNSSPFEIVSGTWQMTMDTIDGVDVKVMECIAAGVVGMPTSLFEATPTEAAFGTWEWWLTKVDGSSPYVMFAGSDLAAIAGGTQSGYDIIINSAERVFFQECAAGAPVSSWWTDIDYVTPGSWNKFRVTRRYDGQFTVYMDDVLINATGGVESNPFTDLTTTTANYVVLEFDAGDKFGYADRRGSHSFVKYLGVIPPG